jgi:hypothetical protein
MPLNWSSLLSIHPGHDLAVAHRVMLLFVPDARTVELGRLDGGTLKEHSILAEMQHPAREQPLLEGPDPLGQRGWVDLRMEHGAHRRVQRRDVAAELGRAHQEPAVGIGALGVAGAEAATG